MLGYRRSDQTKEGMTSGWTKALTRADRLRLSAFGGGVLALHLAGWGLFLYYSRSHPALAGLGTVAYAFGLRHAFDADHIAAIDNTTRKLLQDGGRPLGVGFFFSLGHSTVVFALVAALGLATAGVGAHLPVLQTYGGTFGLGVSGVFLCLIGVLNLLVLLDIVRIFRDLRRGELHEERLEERLQERGLLSRLLRGRLARNIRSSRQMYPVGVLFGLGFDTASEVGLLALAAGAATHRLPFAAVVSLPLLFAAGMSLLDTADGAFMSGAYSWAFADPVRRVYYNLTVTSLSVAVALGVGSVELLRVAVDRLGLDGGVWTIIQQLDFNNLGFMIAGLFAVTWALSAAVWKLRRLGA